VSPSRTIFIHRVYRVGALAAAAVVLSSMASVAAPSATTGNSADDTCESAARLDRAADQSDYTLADLRRIDRRLERTLARGPVGTSAGARFGLVLRIPVHAHVIDGNRTRGLSKRAVLRQLAILNDAYDGSQSQHNASTPFQFYLESFDRTRNQRWRTASMFDDADLEARRRLHQGGPDALNLYFSAPRSPDQDVVLGWSTTPWLAKRFPRVDGVTINEESLPGGDLVGYNRGDTAVHEVGHWLGLFHTFEGGCSPRNDRVEDTPASLEPSLACDLEKDTCESEGLDPVRNFMNYSFDPCMNMFTPGQVARMTDNWLAYRTP